MNAEGPSIGNSPAPAHRSGRPLLRSWRQVLKLSGYQLRDYILSRRFLLMITIVVILSVIPPSDAPADRL
ncbi:MAG: hypothetical protein L3K02_09260, partial [Thermoplasmata archaeon]|nr:hypothetical protein [Thermoplasmata archaeon]